MGTPTHPLCKFLSVLSVTWYLLSALFSLSAWSRSSQVLVVTLPISPPAFLPLESLEFSLLWILSCQHQTKHLLVLPEGPLVPSQSLRSRTQRKNRWVQHIQHIPKYTASSNMNPCSEQHHQNPARFRREGEAAAITPLCISGHLSAVERWYLHFIQKWTNKVYWDTGKINPCVRGIHRLSVPKGKQKGSPQKSLKRMVQEQVLNVMWCRHQDMSNNFNSHG